MRKGLQFKNHNFKMASIKDERHEAVHVFQKEQTMAGGYRRSQPQTGAGGEMEAKAERKKNNGLTARQTEQGLSQRGWRLGETKGGSTKQRKCKRARSKTITQRITNPHVVTRQNTEGWGEGGAPAGVTRGSRTRPGGLSAGNRNANR